MGSGPSSKVRWMTPPSGAMGIVGAGVAGAPVGAVWAVCVDGAGVGGDDGLSVAVAAPDGVGMRSVRSGTVAEADGDVVEGEVVGEADA